MKIHLAILAVKFVVAAAIAWTGYSVISGAMTVVGQAIR